MIVETARPASPTGMGCSHSGERLYLQRRRASCGCHQAKAMWEDPGWSLIGSTDCPLPEPPRILDIQGHSDGVDRGSSTPVGGTMSLSRAVEPRRHHGGQSVMTVKSQSSMRRKTIDPAKKGAYMSMKGSRSKRVSIMPEPSASRSVACMMGRQPSWQTSSHMTADLTTMSSSANTTWIARSTTIDGKLVQNAPLRVLPFSDLRQLGHLPRSCECNATIVREGANKEKVNVRCGQRHDDLLLTVGNNWDLNARPIVMISHSWIEPSQGRPDDISNHKYMIVCSGIRAVCEKHHLREDDICVFVDWCSIAQESFGSPMFKAYVESLPAFIAQMSFIIIPLDASLLLKDKLRLDDDGFPVQMNWAHYSQRGWCRLEMLAGRALAALTEVKVYRYDVAWGHGPKYLHEVPPYTPGSLGIMPTGGDAFFTCCQQDHWDKTHEIEIECDRKEVKLVEQALSDAVSCMHAHRRKLFLKAAGSLLDIHPDLGGVTVVPAEVFFELQEIPRFGTCKTETFIDSELVDKRIFYFSNRFWRPGVHPDLETNMKMRWMQSVLEKLILQEGIDLDQAYVWIDYACIDQDNHDIKLMGEACIPAFIARSTYLVIFATDDKGKSEGALQRGWIRRSLFICRLLSVAGAFTATFVAKLQDLKSLAGMSVSLLDTKEIDPLTYPTTWTQDDSALSKVRHPGDDQYCPFTGVLGVEDDRVIIKDQVIALLKAAAEVPPDHNLRRRLVSRREAPPDHRDRLANGGL